MNKLTTLIALLALMTTSCKTQKVITQEDPTDQITISVKYSEMPCLEEDRSPEEIEAMMEFKPFAKGVLYMASLGRDLKLSNHRAVNFDANGIVKMSLDTGVYVVGFYPLIAERAEGDTTELNDRERCMQEWMRMSAMPFPVVKDKSTYDLLMTKECSPCPPAE